MDYPEVKVLKTKGPPGQPASKVGAGHEPLKAMATAYGRLAVAVPDKWGVFLRESKQWLCMFSIILHKATIITSQAKKLSYLLYSGGYLKLGHSSHLVSIRMYAGWSDTIAENGKFTEAKMTLAQFQF